MSLHFTTVSLNPNLNSTIIHRVAEMPLNHLGLHLTLEDLRQPLPEVTAISNCRAVLLWLRPGAKPTEQAVKWIADAA